MPSGTLGHPSLLPLRNALFLGSYGTVVSRALQVNIDPSDDEYKAATIEKDTLIYRAQIGQSQYDVVLNDIEDSDQTHVSLRAVRLLARYFAAGNDREKQDAVIQQLDTFLEDSSLAADATLAIVATSIYLQEKKPADALKFVFTPSNLEMAALKVICYLHMNLISEAIEAQKTLSEMNDESSITLLTQGLVLLCQGGEEKLNEASNIFSMLTEKVGETPLLANCKANVAMQTTKWQEAEASLMSAFSKKSNDVDTLSNLITTAYHMKKPRENIARYMNQVKTLAPNNAYYKSVQEAEADFDRLASKYKAQN